MMDRALQTRAGKAVALAGLAALIGLAPGHNATAQLVEWEEAFGGSGRDAARGGMVALNTGELVAAGECEYQGRKDIYVSSTAVCGFSQWANRYDLGGDEVAHKIRSTADGGFIVVGTANNLPRCGSLNDIFLLKLDANGSVLWTKTYGGEGNEEGWDVQVAADGYVVAGRTASFGAGNIDAFLMKTDLNGNTLWAWTYGTMDEEFYTSCVIAGNGDIIATGGRGHGGATMDLYLVRHSSFGGPGFSVTAGGMANDMGWRVIEAANGDFVIAGGTVNANGRSEGYLMRVDPSFGLIVDRRCASTNSLWDEFLDMAETPRGTFLVTGLLASPQGGNGGVDMYVGEYDGNLALVNDAVHGGTENDEGWGIAYVPNPLGISEYAVAGLTESYGQGSTDLYMVRQRMIGGNGCAGDINLTLSQPYYFPRPVYDATNYAQPLECNVVTVPLHFGEPFTPCSNCNVPKTTGQSESPEMTDAAGALQAYPNPLSVGDPLTLRFTASPEARRTITVSDLTGKVVYTTQTESGDASVPTDGWAAGNYLIRVTGTNVDLSSRIVLHQK